MPTPKPEYFSSLLGPNGLLRDTSVILATNQVYRFANASYLTVLHEGSIAEQGDYATLLAQEDGMMSKASQRICRREKGPRDR